jgi:hypothetical protein
MLATIALLSYAITSTSSFGPIQSPGRPDWDILAAESSVIIVGVVENYQSVIRRDRMGSDVKQLPNGQKIVELPNPDNYSVGHLISIRIQEILKNNGRVKTQGVVSIYVPGSFHREGMPSFVEKERYLVFLSPLKADHQSFVGATILQSAESSKEPPFNPSSKYVVVRGDNGSVNLTSRNSNVINEVKAALTK